MRHPFGSCVLIVGIFLAAPWCKLHSGEPPPTSISDLLGLPAEPPITSGPPKRALLVGISEYSRGGSGDSRWSDLTTQDDINIMHDVLVRKFGFNDRDVRIITESQATRADIEGAFRDHLITPAKPGDVVLFYFSGHGQLVPDPTAWGGTRPALVTFDYIDQDARNGFRTHLRSDHLRELLRELKARMKDENGTVSGNITVILDSCHSGGGTKNEMQSKGRPWDDAIDGPKPMPVAGAQPLGAGGYLDADQAIAEGYTFISACRSDQTALCPVQGTKVSLLTYHLAEGLAKSGPNTTYRDLYEPVSVVLSRLQIPQLEGDANKRVLAGTAMPAEHYWLVQDVSSGVVTLPVGFVQGMTKGSRFALYRQGTSVRKLENKLGEVEVTDVLTTSSRARLTANPASFSDADLAGARAVESFHNYAEQNLRVWLDGVTLPAGWMQQDDYLVSEGVTKDDFDVAIRNMREPPDSDSILLVNGKPVVNVQRRDGTSIAQHKLAEHTDKQFAALLRNRLLGEWRWVFLSRHLKAEGRPGDRLCVEIRVVPLNVEVDPNGKPLRILGTRQDFRENQALKQFRVGDWVTIEVRNSSQAEDVYISLLDLGPEGSVGPLFPPKTNQPLTQYAPAKLAVAQGWTRIPNFVIRFNPPVGREIFKVIATLEPADFRDLIYLPPGLDGKGAVNALSARSKGLGQLLDQARQGKKDVTIMSIGPDWASAEVAFEVVK